MWFAIGWLFLNYMIVQFFRISMNFVRLMQHEAQISLRKARALFLFISFIIFSSNLYEYVVEYGSYLNCIYLHNTAMAKVFNVAHYATVYQHNAEMVVLGLFTLYIIVFMV